jgi:Lar family restriction alleviation protein
MTKLNAEMTKLKPCPFCGSGKVNVIEHKFYHLPSSYGVRCFNCKTESYQYFDTQEEAIEAWNRRTGDTEALRKAARKLAWIHQQIDLYDDRQELHEEDYWMDYLTDPEWIDPDIEWKGEE